MEVLFRQTRGSAKIAAPALPVVQQQPLLSLKVLPAVTEKLRPMDLNPQVVTEKPMVLVLNLDITQRAVRKQATAVAMVTARDTAAVMAAVMVLHLLKRLSPIPLQRGSLKIFVEVPYS